MKKLVLVFLFLTSLSFGQISPTEFPKIGFADLYWLKLAPNNRSGTINYSAYKYYYPELKTLGLTHVVTMGDDTPFNTAYNPGIKIIDNNFSYFHSTKSGYIPAAFATGQGNDPSSLPYEAGGNGYSVCFRK